MVVTENVINNFMGFTGAMTAMYLGFRVVMSAISGFVARKAPSAANLKVLEDRLARIEQIVESSALEIERIGEGQRFTTRVLTERTAVPAALSPHNPRNPLT